MDMRLVAWGRAVKSRRRGTGKVGPPPLWLFTDPARMADVEAAVAALPRGLCGVVFRHDGVPGRGTLLGRVARRCRDRRLALVVAGKAPIPAAAGRHLRGGRGQRTRRGLTTSSAHGMAELVRARRAGAELVFVSPVFATTSHPGAAPLGPLRFGTLTRREVVACCALGGLTGRNVRRLPAMTAGAGAIGALLA